MNPKPILITAAALAFSAWPLLAQEKAPEPPPQNQPPREDARRRPEADRPEAPREQDARPPRRERGPRNFQRPDFQDERRGPRREGPPPDNARAGDEGPRQGPPPMQVERRERVQAGPGNEVQAPRFHRRDSGPQAQPGDRFAGGWGDSMQKPHRPMSDNYGFAPRRDEEQSYRGVRRGGESERRAPQFHRFGPDRGPGPMRDELERRPPPNGPRDMMRPRADFNRDDREARGPRDEYDAPRPPMRPPFRDDGGPGPDRPHRDGPPPPHPGRDDVQRPSFN